MTHTKLPFQAITLPIDQIFQQAVSHHQAGHIQDAESLYLAVLQNQPDHEDAKHNLNILIEQVKQAITELPRFKAELEANPDQEQYWLNYIDALLLAGQTDIAQQVLQLGLQHGLQHEMVNLLTERLAHHVQRASQLPGHPSAEESSQTTRTTSKNKKTKKAKTENKRTKSNKKTSLHKEKIPPQQQIDTLANLFSKELYAEVIPLAQQMTEDFPNYDFGWKALGAGLKQMGRNADALTPLLRAAELSPNDAEIHNNLGITYKVLEQTDKAESSCRRALQIKPDLAEAHNTLGIILYTCNRFDEAEASYREALKLKPDYACAYNNLSNTLQELSRLEEAEAYSYQALKIKPDYAAAYLTLGNISQHNGRPDEAEIRYRKALEIEPDYAAAHNNLSTTLHDLGRLDEAEAGFHQALQIAPDDDLAFSNLLFTLNYSPDKSAEEIFKYYQEYETKYCLPLQKEWRPHSNDRNINRRLKIGYVSPDYRNHSVQFFLEPLLVHHDKQAVEVYAYAELITEDFVTARYKGYVDHWVPTRNMSDSALTERIRADGIDILVDLAGHSAKNRLQVFAHKPAPVSLSWLGYGYTTGLTAIDYFLTDIASTPQGSEELFSETPYRIATPSCSYRPCEGMGEVNPLPALTRGYITFGTLTRPVRINHRTIRVWSEILKRVQNSRLVIDNKAFREKTMQDMLADKFVAHGIARDRLEIDYHTPPWDVLRGTDIGLDCFPHNSGTTLFENLYMGVPYITLAGRPSVG
ncbi:MAG: tetratricopeptide repeat protein, partial [Nitrosomonas sp.]|nr:tetratricopeptide repeat protein [Nitrosomonas sp.]